MKRIIVLAAAFALVGCGDNQAGMKETVRGHLTDPGSAKFGRYEQVNSKNRDWACLEVNAKGPGGGYTGAKAARFVAPAHTTNWLYQDIAGTFDECVSMIRDMQPFEGGAR
jgi:hypothetical protein